MGHEELSGCTWVQIWNSNISNRMNAGLIKRDLGSPLNDKDLADDAIRCNIMNARRR